MVAFGYARDGETPLCTLPGWTPDTYGVHSDDGLLQVNGACTKVMPAWQVNKGNTVGMGSLSGLFPDCLGVFCRVYSNDRVVSFCFGPEVQAVEETEEWSGLQGMMNINSL